jgi:phosphohistidine phosphatase
MKVLYLLRHAKSSWDDPSFDDHDRPLAPRGRRAAKRIARHMRAEGIRPELVLCSSARRTRETLGLVSSGWDGEVPVRIERRVYAAGDGDLLALINEVPEEVESVLLIGHNPGLETLALALAARGPYLGRLEEKYPTGALASLAFDGRTWADLGPGTAELVGFVVPRDLA